MAPVRKLHKFLTLKEKAEIIKQLEKGTSGVLLAEKYKVQKSTITGIKKNKEKLLSYLQQTGGYFGKRKTTKQTEMPKMVNALYLWFEKQRQRNVAISASILCEKAKQLNKKFNEAESFSASEGWLNNFKKRFGIRYLKVCGEKLSNRTELVHPFLLDFHEKIESMNLCPDQIYNADESGLYWKMLPDSTMVLRSEKSAPGRKVSKDRITILVCTNASGSHKLDPLLIGKLKNPRSFKNFKVPLRYRSKI